MYVQSCALARTTKQTGFNQGLKKANVTEVILEETKVTSAAFRVRVCVVVWNESHLNEVRFFRGPFIPVSDLYTYVVAWQSLCLFLCLWQDSDQAERPVLLTNSWKVSKLKQLEAIFWISNRHSILQIDPAAVQAAPSRTFSSTACRRFSA